MHPKKGTAKKYKFGSKVLDFSFPVYMGIVNVTPDSFSDGGKYFNTRSAISHGLNLLNEGADIIDIGGESSRPGAEAVTVTDELKRVIPVIKGILKKKRDTLISIDTTKSEVAEEALKEGAVIINDISGGTADDKIFDVVAKYHAGMILMHMKGTPKTMQANPTYSNVTDEVKKFLIMQVRKAVGKKISKIFVDPGIGFGKTVDHNFILINELRKFNQLGYPVVVGVSRKSFIGKTLDLPPENRDVPTAIMEAFALQNGAAIIRTHSMVFGSYTKKLKEALARV